MAGSGSEQISKQSFRLFFQYAVTLADVRLQFRSICYLDMSTPIAEHARLLQFSGSFGDAFAPHTKHTGNQFLGHRQTAGVHPVKIQE